jgi:hypothetical protein
MSLRRVVVAAALAALAVALGPSNPAAATTVTPPTTIDTTGSTDVTAALEQFFASVPAGATVELPSAARYRVDGVLRLQNLQHVTIDGNGALLFAPDDGKALTPPGPKFRLHWPRLREHVEIDGADTLVIRNLAVHGPNASGKYVAALEGQAGFAVLTSSNVELDRVSVSNTYGDGVYVAGKSTDVTVRSGNFENTGRQGVAIVSAANVLVELDHFRGVGRSVVDVEPSSPRSSVTGVHVQNNEIGDYHIFAFAAGGAGAGVNDLWFVDNHITGGSGISVFAGMTHWQRHGLHIIGNHSDVEGKVVGGTGRDGVMQLARIDGVEIKANVQRVAGNVPVVTLDGVCNLVMSDNDFQGSSSQQQQVTAPCGQVSATPPRAAASSGPKTSRNASSRPAASPSADDDSTDTGWIIVGGGLGAVALAAFLALVWRDRRRATG